MKCRFCGKNIRKNAIYCPKCRQNQNEDPFSEDEFYEESGEPYEDSSEPAYEEPDFCGEPEYPPAAPQKKKSLLPVVVVAAAALMAIMVFMGPDEEPGTGETPSSATMQEHYGDLQGDSSMEQTEPPETAAPSVSTVPFVTGLSPTDPRETESEPAQPPETEPAATQPPETAPEQEQIDPSSAVLPDLTVFLGRRTSKDGRYYEGQQQLFQAMPYDMMPTVLEEILALLQQGRYQLELTAFHPGDSDENTYTDRYDFRYTGTCGGVDLVTNQKETSWYHVQIVVTHYTKAQEFNLRMHYSSGFTLEDPGMIASVVAEDPEETDDPLFEDCKACYRGKCRRCDGLGYIQKTLPGTTEKVKQDCTNCVGGKCPRCHGDGHL